MAARILLPLAGAIVLAASWTNIGTAATPRTDTYPLHAGATAKTSSRGPRVSGLQWMLAGHVPSVYRGIRPYVGRPTGLYGSRTAAAVRSAKRELGYPTRYVTGTAGRTLVAYLRGELARPRPYVLTALARARARDAATAAATRAATTQARLIGLAKRYVGTSEYPWGSNCGRTVRMFQSATGAYCAAWCASFQNWLLKTVGYGTIADRSAGVQYITSWSARRGWLRAKPMPGRLAYYGGRHINLVVGVTSRGFYTVGGNESNGVRYRFNRTGSASGFIGLPRVSF